MKSSKRLLCVLGDDQFRDEEVCSDMARINRALLLIATSLGILLLPAGCAASRIHASVPAFAQAVTLTSKNTQTAFETVEGKYAEVQSLSLVVDYDTKGFNPQSVKDWLAPEDFNVRMKLLQALQAYASSLEQVSAGDQLQQLDSTAKEFGTALGQLANSGPLQKLASQASVAPNVATTAVDAIGHWLIERKRSKELPNLIEQMQEPVKSICNLLVQDIGSHESSSTRGSGLRSQLWLEYQQLLMTEDLYIKQNEVRFSPAERRAEIEKLPIIVREQRIADQTLAQTQSALQQLIKANAEVLAATKTKQDLRANISALVSDAERIKDFYESLSNSK